jgi:hypothetical protein
MKSTNNPARIAESLLRSGWTLRLRATGRSMKPLLREGCLLRIEPSSGPPRRGDIVAFRAAGDRLVIHRVLECDGNGIWTKGDASARRDDRIVQSQILGRVLGIEEPFFIPLTGRLAVATGLFLNRFYPSLVKVKAALGRRLRGALTPMEVGEG